jgi:cellulose biosynthesis protein BcsQ
MKVVANINFKGGVGKTTITWLLAKHAAEKEGQNVLVVDADAQMSLTIALTIDEQSGQFVPGFKDWYEKRHTARQKTLLYALDSYDRYARGTEKHFNFPIDSNFIYEVSPKLYFIPSVTDLYWMELELFNPENVKGFIKAILGKIQHSNYKPDIVFFDCPPSFTALSYSILSNCSLILVPTNPDVFAATGLRIMVEGLRGRIQPWPDPKIAVFMNKAGYRVDIGLTRETRTFMGFIEGAANSLNQQQGSKIRFLSDAYIPFRAAIRKSISFGGFPEELRPNIKQLWDGIKSVM